MYARVTTHEGGNTDELRRLNEQRAADGTLGLPDGVRRALVLGGNDTRLFITFFDNKEDIAAAEARFEAMGDEIPEQIRGKRTSVEIMEVLFDAEP